GGERGRLGQGREGIPGGNKGLLDHVLGLLEVPDERERVTKRHVLEPPGDLGERVQVAARCPPYRRFHVHGWPSAYRCQDRGASFENSRPERLGRDGWGRRGQRRLPL